MERLNCMTLFRNLNSSVKDTWHIINYIWKHDYLDVVSVAEGLNGYIRHLKGDVHKDRTSCLVLMARYG